MRSERRPVLWQSKAASKHSLRRSRLSVPHPFNRKRRPLSAPILAQFLCLGTEPIDLAGHFVVAGNGEKMSKLVVDGGDVAELLDRFAQIQEKARSQREDSFQS